MSLGAPEIVLIIVAFLLLVGYKKLPDASRSIGRSLRIFKGEMKGLREDDVRTREPAATTPVRGEVVPTVVPSGSTAAGTDDAARLAEEAAAAEARAAELRARAEQARAASGTAPSSAAPSTAPASPSAEGPR